jgi:hypothetical protein
MLSKSGFGHPKANMWGANDLGSTILLLTVSRIGCPDLDVQNEDVSMTTKMLTQRKKPNPYLDVQMWNLVHDSLFFRNRIQIWMSNIWIDRDPIQIRIRMGSPDQT